MISAEDILPYDRTLITKALPVIDSTKNLMRPAEFLKNADINYKLGTKVTKVDTDSKTIELSSGEKIVSFRILY